MTQEDNLIVQSQISTSFLIELKNNNFLQSSFYKSMKFGVPELSDTNKIETLTREKIKRNFEQISSSYFTEIYYDENDKFFDLYFNLNPNGISENQVNTYNELIENLDKYLIQINSFIKSTYTNSEKKKTVELNNKKLNIDVIQIAENNKNFDAVIVCGKQYKYFGILKKDIGIRAEIKNSRISTIERKTDTTKENLNNKNVLQHRV